jgi:6-pyruvoyltetrahydropterin/6-carboxytetrahydropterin synthase
MHRLTREIRFAVNATEDDQLTHAPTNSYGGYPSLTGLGYFFTLAATVEGPLDPQSNYLLNIKQIDAMLRAKALPVITRHVRARTFGGGGRVLQEVFEAVAKSDEKEGVLLSFPSSFRRSVASSLSPTPPSLSSLTLRLSPFQTWSIHASEHPMIRLSQMFEFAATHRLHNPALSESENRSIYGKCNNPHGHGHNYQLQVSLVGQPDANGMLINVPRLEKLVAETVIDRFDHKNLNVELPEFAERIPSVENIAQVIYRLLQPRLKFEHARLASVTVWETPKTWCEYGEE